MVPGDTEYCLVMDADHHPARDHTARAVALMERYDLDVLQARPPVFAPLPPGLRSAACRAPVCTRLRRLLLVVYPAVCMVVGGRSMHA